MAHLSRIAVYPVKSLDPDPRERVHVTDAGGLEDDRRFAVVDADGDYVNGKRTAAVHRLRSTFDAAGGTVTLRVEADEPRTFRVDGDRTALEAWLSEYFGRSVAVIEAPGGELTDSAAGAGPTLIAAATLREVASWFPGLDPAAVRRRLRPNLVIDGVPAFWEDRLVGADGGRTVRIGDVRLRGVKPVPRCVVPTRDARTGETTDGFRETFLRRREETFPGWADRDAFDHLYSLMVVTEIPAVDRGAELRVGDAVASSESADA